MRRKSSSAKDTETPEQFALELLVQGKVRSAEVVEFRTRSSSNHTSGISSSALESVLRRARGIQWK